MLSKENQEKLCITGLYGHDPDRRYRGSLYWDRMYHCFNWTFRVRRHEEKFYMVDTYFNDQYIELTDDNFKEFELIFDYNEVKSHSGQNIDDYNECDYWNVAVDSGGIYCGGKYFVKKDAKKNKDKVLERLQYEIERAKSNLESKERNYQMVLSGERDIEYA